MLPLPHLSPSLVGRDRELPILRTRLNAALARQGSLVLIGGEAGIGKTALAEMICLEAVEQGARVLIGRCYDLTETPPYGPWIDLFGGYAPGDDLPALPAAFAQPGAIGDITSQVVLFEQTQRFFAATQQPLVLLLDDLQWSDRESLDLLRSLARTLAGLPLLLLVTYRADELTRRHLLSQLIPQLVREAAAVRVDLRQIDDDAVRLLVSERYRLIEAETAQLVNYLQRRAEGNPLFVGELLRTLEEAGILRRESGHWVLGDLALTAVPTLLRQVIDARVDRLGGAAKSLLGVAAIIGQDVPYAVWAAVAGTDEATLIAVVEQAEDARVMEETPDGVARFTHALIRETLFEEVRPSQRRGWHRKVGDVLAAGSFPDPDAVAYHFQHASDPRAVTWLIQAGDRARKSYALVSAAERYAAALALLDEAGAGAGERAWLAFRLARAQWLADPVQALRHLDNAAHLAESAGDRALQVGLRYQRGFLLCMRGEMRRGIAELEAAVPAIAALSRPDRAYLTERGWGSVAAHPDIAGLLPEWLAWTGRFDDALVAGGPIVRDAPEAHMAPAGSYPAYAAIYLGAAVAHAGKGEPDEATRAWAAARSFNLLLDHAHQIGMDTFQELNWCALPYRADRLDERRMLADEAEAAWQRAGGSRPDVVPAAARLLLLLVEGRWDEAGTIARRTRDARSSGWSSLVPNRVLAAIARACGMADEAWGYATEMLVNGAETAPGDIWFLDTLPLLRLAALIAIDRGTLPVAGAWLAGHDRWLAWSGAVLGRSEGRRGWAGYYRATGDVARAHHEATVALAHATEPRQPLALLAAHRLLGELDSDAGRFADAATHLDTALALADACAAPYERALTLLARAELHAARGTGSEALLMLDEVRTLCAPLGALPALARADALATRLVASERRGPTYPAGLSEREVEVLRLVVAGLTNAQVAEQLFLSEHTVRHHLSHILVKTDAANRAEAVAFALRHGIA